MSIAERWLLPEGINEILPSDAKKLEMLRRLLLDEYSSWGYQLVCPPIAEYLESLLTGVGHDLDLLTYKIIDQQNGRLMGLSADRTQQVARMDAHSLPCDGVSRYYYCAEVLHTKPVHSLSSRNPMQIGAELFGYAGVESEMEVISLMITTLDVAKIENVTIDLGHVGIYRAIADILNLSSDQHLQLFELLRDRALPELEQWIHNSHLETDYQRLLRAFIRMVGNETYLDDWKQSLSLLGETVARFMDTLALVAKRIKERFPKVNVHFDLVELRGYEYHTGMVFSAFVPGYGQSIARGGRYDATGEVFGRSRPATGFSCDLKVLMALSQLSDEIRKEVIVAPASYDPELLAVMSELRYQGKTVIQMFPGQLELSTFTVDKELVLIEGQWQVRSNVNKGVSHG